VTREDLLAYWDVLERCGLVCQLQEEGELLSVTCVYEGGTTRFLLSGEKTYISTEDIPLCFVPGWYWNSRSVQS